MVGSTGVVHTYTWNVVRVSDRLSQWDDVDTTREMQSGAAGSWVQNTATVDLDDPPVLFFM